MTMRMVVMSDGYLGARLCAAVAGAGHDVRVFVLHGVDVSGLLLAAEVAYGDVANEESPVAAFGGCDAVFDNRRGRRGVAPDASIFHTVRGSDLVAKGEARAGIPSARHEAAAAGPAPRERKAAASREGLFGK
jgi:hypothetical protein